MSDALYWHCLRCGAHEQVEPTGGSDDEYVVGDQEKCIDCGDGFCRVVTLRMGAGGDALGRMGR